MFEMQHTRKHPVVRYLIEMQNPPVEVIDKG